MAGQAQVKYLNKNFSSDPFESVVGVILTDHRTFTDSEDFIFICPAAARVSETRCISKTRS